MINNISISGIKFELDESVKKYVNRKIGKLDRFLPRHIRGSVSVEAFLKEVNRDHGNRFEAEIIFHLPEKIITASDATLNIFAAIDIVELKLINQLKKYKETRNGSNKNILKKLKDDYFKV